MKFMKFFLPVIVLIGAAYPAHAQLFTRKLRLNMQVPELIVTARSDTDERKRLAAVEQLREFDVKTYPEIIPSVIEVMLRDPKYNIRMEAMHSLVKMRPISQVVGQALHQTAMNDENWRVRMQTKTQIWLNGYQNVTGNGQLVAPTPPSLKEPPLGGAVVGGSAPPTYIPNTTGPSGPSNISNTIGRPLPPSRPPGFSTAVPQQPTEAPMPVQVPPNPPPLIQIPAGPPPQPPVPLPVPTPPPSNDPVAVPIVPPRN